MNGSRTLKKSRTARLFVIFFAVTAVTMFFAWTRLQNIRIQREINRLGAQETRINLEINSLRLRFAQLTSPNRLEEAGVSRFGLKRPSPKQVLILREP